MPGAGGGGPAVTGPLSQAAGAPAAARGARQSKDPGGRCSREPGAEAALSGTCGAGGFPVGGRGLHGDRGPSVLLQEDMSRQKAGEKPSGGLPFFHWICQPYLRPG